MKTIRRWLYRRGYRPRRRSIFFSPSLHMIYAAIDKWPDLRDDLSGNW